MQRFFKRLLLAALTVLLPAVLSAGEAAERHKRAQAYYDKGNFAGAVAEYTRAIQLDPSGSSENWEAGSAYLDRGGAYFNQGDYDLAIADYSEAVRRDPRGPVGRKAKSDREDAYRAKRSAESDRRAAAVRQKVAVTDHYNIGIEAYQLGDYTKAISDLTKAAENNSGMTESVRPYLSLAYGKRGDKAYQAGDYSKAIADYNAALRLNPGLVNISASRDAAMQKLNGPRPASGAGAFGVKAAPKSGAAAFGVKGGPAAPAQDNTLVIGLIIALIVLGGVGYFLYRKYNPDHMAMNRQPGLVAPEPAAGIPFGNQPVLYAAGGNKAAQFDMRIGELMDAGDYSGALAAYGTRHPADITDGDRINLFELHLRLGNFDRAGLVFEGIKGNAKLTGNLELYGKLAGLCYEKGQGALARRLSRGIFESMRQSEDIRNSPEQYYHFARYCEGQGDIELAAEIYRMFIEIGRDGYQDVLLRYNDLKGRAPAAPPPPPRPPQGGAKAFRSGPPPGGTALAGRYELVGELGTGGMGIVYRGQDSRTGQPVAVKRMHTVLKDSPGEYERFIGEAKIVERLSHPGIVSVHGVVEQDGETYLIFDFVDGRTLGDILKEKRRLPLEECQRIFREVCSAVSYAHKNNIIHRDLKPGNIMLTAAGEVKVMDFGLASELRECMTRVTHQTMSGTPAYMAPEQYSGTVKRESDIYGMGVCLYEMLTGTLPFSGHEMEKLKKERNYQSVSAILPWLPGGTDAVIDRALDPEPSQRYADALDFYEALRNL